MKYDYVNPQLRGYFCFTKQKCFKFLLDNTTKKQ